jgi:hypothetical protein
MMSLVKYHLDALFIDSPFLKVAWVVSGRVGGRLKKESVGESVRKPRPEEFCQQSVFCLAKHEIDVSKGHVAPPAPHSLSFFCVSSGSLTNIIPPYHYTKTSLSFSTDLHPHNY